MPHRRIRAHFKQTSKFERLRIIEKKRGRLTNRKIARHMGRSDAALEDVGKNGLSNTSLASHITRVLSVKHIWDMTARRLHFQGYVEDLTRVLDQFFGNKYHWSPPGCFITNSMTRCVAACIQVKGGSTPY
ncbi:hypothetical protein TNCV_14951 [Trichonephila clavipes]|nr:hypothetical protein TNCV_14951 [Trichonephila clavipes]